MLATQAQSDIVADNLTNISTPGYKEEQGSNRAFQQVLLERIGGSAGETAQGTLIGSMGTGVVVDKISRVNILGTLQTTDKQTDLALSSQGFFAIKTPNGERYTRNGQFELNSAGVLQTSGGYPVLGEKGAIGPLSQDFMVMEDGTVMDGGKVIDKLKVVEIPEASLQREGESLYAATQVPQRATGIQISQGVLEGSNVDLSGQTTQLMTIMRAYEANQKVIQTIDSTLDKAVNEVGRI